MFDWHHINWIYSLSGLIVGVLVGLTGVGGGSLMTPLLILLFGVAPGTAVGTDLLYAAITKSGGVLVHGFHKTIDWKIVRRLAAGSVPATILTIFILSHIAIDQHKASHHIISTVLGIAVLLTAVSLVLRNLILARLAPFVDGLSDKSRAGCTVALGFVLGVCVSVSSVGAGAIGVTILILLYPKLPAVRIVGADIAHAVPLTLVAGLGHVVLGTVNWDILASLVIGSLPGIMISSHIAAHVPDRILRPLLAGTLAVAGLRLAI